MSPSSPGAATESRHIGAIAAAAVVALVVGYVYLRILRVALDVLWDDVPGWLGNQALVWVYTLAMTTAGAAAVAYLRRRTNVFGHSPLDGLKVTPDPVRVSLIATVAVIITLLSGAVLGPEAGLLAIGTAIGTLIGNRSRLQGRSRSTLITAGVGGALAALVAELGVGHTISITSGSLSLALGNLLGSVPVAVVAALVAALVRLAGYRLRGWADLDPTVIWRVALVGLLIGLCGMVGTAIAQSNPRLILGSGEGYIVEVVQMTSLSTLFVIIVAKGIAYSLSLGGGIRGGPIFPAMFIGAAVGSVAAVLQVPGESTALAAAGLLAGTTVGLAVGWRGLVIGGVVIGLLLGSWLLIPPSIVGMLVGRGVGSALGRLPGVGPVPDPHQQAARLDDQDSLGS